jgi:hypothetical protein
VVIGQTHHIIATLQMKHKQIIIISSAEKTQAYVKALTPAAPDR